MYKTNIQSKNIFHLLLGLLMTMVSLAEASTLAVGEWKFMEVWRANEAEPLAITRDGTDYILRISPADESNPNRHKLSIKVGNSMGSSFEILEDNGDEQKIKVGMFMSSRMMPGSVEKAELEGYVMDAFPKFDTLKVNNEELIFSSEGGARIICAPMKESQN